MVSIVFKPDEPTPTNEARKNQWEQRFNLVRGEDASPSTGGFMIVFAVEEANSYDHDAVMHIASSRELADKWIEHRIASDNLEAPINRAKWGGLTINDFTVTAFVVDGVAL